MTRNEKQKRLGAEGINESKANTLIEIYERSSRALKKRKKNMNQEKNTNWKTLYMGLLVITVLMILAMLLFQNYYK